MFSSNALILISKDLQLGPYFLQWQLEIDLGLSDFSLIFIKIILVAKNPRVV